MTSALEDLFNNVTLSVLTLNLGSTASVNATLFDAELVFAYNSRRLAGPYAYALVASLLACLVGSHSMRSNGFSARAGFEAFVDAPRSDSMMDPDVLGGRARIKYSPLAGDNGRYGFVKEGVVEASELEGETLLGQAGQLGQQHPSVTTL